MEKFIRTSNIWIAGGLIALLITPTLYGIDTGEPLRTLTLLITIPLSLAYMGISGYSIARALFNLPKTLSIYLAPLMSLGSIIFVTTPIYLLYNLSVPVFHLCISIPAISASIAIWQVKRKPPTTALAIAEPRTLHPHHPILITIYLVGAAITLAILLKAQTINSILGPWQAVNPLLFGVYALSTAALVTLIARKVSPLIALPLTCMHYALSFFVTEIVFPLGFGFDPFLHRAAETIIAHTGQITPKTLYYIGQYTSVAYLSKLFSMDVTTIDRILTPLLASISLPPLLFYTAQNALHWTRQKSLWTMLVFLILPFSIFTATTPWALAVLFTLAMILIAAFHIRNENKPKLLITSLAIVATCIHPLAGLPAAGFALLHHLLGQERSYTPWNNIKLIITLIFTSLLTPAAFILNASLSSQLQIKYADNISTDEILTLITSTLGALTTRFSAPLDLAYLIPNLYGGIILGATLVSLIVLISRKKDIEPTYPFIAAGFVTLVQFVLVKKVLIFSNIIDYERDVFADRLLSMALLFLLPLTLALVTHITHTFITNAKEYRALTLASATALTMLITASFYTSYPTMDAYTVFHGYNVSQANRETVRWIERDAAGKDYVVLSNQVVAAAAIEHQGFKRYFKYETQNGIEKLFYYPTPTSSPLYTAYREMLTNPSEALIQEVKQMLYVDRVYFVINSYEPQARGKIDATALTTQHHTTIVADQSQNDIFWW